MSATEKYTPTTEHVREDFAYPWEGHTQDRPARLEAFDRWLIAVRTAERDRTIQQCKAELDEAHRFEDGVYEIVTKLGFTGRGLGKRTAVLDALDALATSRARAAAIRAQQNQEDMADLIANTYANEFYDPAHKAADAVIAHLLPATEGAKK